MYVKLDMHDACRVFKLLLLRQRVWIEGLCSVKVEPDDLSIAVVFDDHHHLFGDGGLKTTSEGWMLENSVIVASRN